MKTNKQVVKDVPTIIILVSALAITLALIVLSFFTIVKPFSYTKFSDLKTTNDEKYLTLDGNKNGEYYVYIYQADSYKHELPELHHTLLDYANYVKRKEDARPIYTLEFGNDYYGSLRSDLGLQGKDLSEGLPMLVLIRKGSISKKESTISLMMSELNNLIAD